MKRTLTMLLLFGLCLPGLALTAGRAAGQVPGAAAETPANSPRDLGTAGNEAGGDVRSLGFFAPSRVADASISGAPRRDLGATFSTYELLDFERDTMTRKAPGPLRVSMRLAGVERELLLEPNDLRAPSYRATLTTDEGMIEEPTSAVSTYKGTVEGVDDSDVRLLIHDEMISGYVRTPDDWVFLEPARAYDPASPPERVVVYRDGDVLPEHRGSCGTAGLTRQAEAIGGDEDAVAKAGTSRVDGLRVLDVATDADFEFHQATGGMSNLTIQGILNQVDGIYRRELGIRLELTFQHAFTTADDPYSATNPKDLLVQFKFNFLLIGAGFRRDVAHLFTGKVLDGGILGIAWTGQVCDFGKHYGLSRNQSSAFLTKTVAHEIGHNLGTKHDPKSACGGSGPLMCPSQQFSGANVFSQKSKNSIRAWIAIQGHCLDVSHDDAEFYTTDGAGGITELNGLENLHDGWDVVVSGQFGGDAPSDLLFYDREAGRGELYTTDAQGRLTLLRAHSDWDRVWDVIVPGDFDGDALSDLLFYDRESGIGAFFASDGGGGLVLLQQHNDWDRGWDGIVPGQFGGDGRTDLLFYDRERGIGSFWTTDGRGGIGHIRDYLDWDTDWDVILAGDFFGDGFSDLLLYKRSLGLGEFYGTDGAGGMSLIRAHGDWDRGWDVIVLGQFGGDGRTDLLFYDRDAKLGSFWATDGDGGVANLRDHGGWRDSWHAIVAGDFGGDGFTDLFFYER